VIETELAKRKAGLNLFEQIICFDSNIEYLVLWARSEMIGSAIDKI
jgi:hypothetical protein